MIPPDERNFSRTVMVSLGKSFKHSRRVRQKYVFTWEPYFMANRSFDVYNLSSQYLDRCGLQSLHESRKVTVVFPEELLNLKRKCYYMHN